MTAQTALYRLYDADDRLLYIGITKNLEQRWTGHRHSATSSKWWPDVVRKVIEWHPSQEAADAAETAAIETEEPLHNRAKLPYGRWPDRTPLSPELDWKTHLEDPYSKQAARILAAEIKSGAIQPGDVMPSAKDLHNRFGLSAGTCGEVLRSMATEGLIHQRARGGRYYCSQPGEVTPFIPEPKLKPPTGREVATQLQAVSVDGIPVEAVERRRRNRRWPRKVLGAHLQMRPYSQDPVASQPHVNIELGPNEVVELDADGLATFVEQLEAQCAALRQLQGQLEQAKRRRPAA
ncbi:DUF6907 domain-containing protein [Streptomyces sp. NPDC092046]|uniref:DUF6907 domain-containing protein n=1 Tax=Streptomyces sp. NPDC092046 TaxID=3366009 RepID=UPI00380309D8